MSDVISWEDYFINLAILASLRSKEYLTDIINLVYSENKPE